MLQLSADERTTVESYLPLVHAVVRRVPARGEYDDLVQEATFGVVRALRSWHPGFVCSEASWVWRCVASAVRDAYRLRSLDRGKGVTFVPLEDAHTVADDTAEVEVADAFERFVATLQPRDRTVLLARGQGRELAAIGAEVGVTDTRVCQIVRKLRTLWDSRTDG